MTALSTTAPDLAPAAVEALVRRIYGIEGSARPLAGERDQNCLVQASDGRRYVFKISNPSEPAEVVDFQIAALDHIARVSPDQPVPRVVLTLDGSTHGTVKLAEDLHTRVRMLTYLDGIQIRETERTAAQRRAMGRGLAGLNRALRDFAHPGVAHDLLWNVSAAHRLTEQLDGLVDDKQIASGAFDGVNLDLSIGRPNAALEVMPAARRSAMGIIGREIFFKGEIFRIGQELGIDDTAVMAHVAIRWAARQQPDVMIVGAGDRDQLDANVRSLQADAGVDDELVRQIRSSERFAAYERKHSANFFERPLPQQQQP